jgi:hypothetical protein
MTDFSKFKRLLLIELLGRVVWFWVGKLHYDDCSPEDNIGLLRVFCYCFDDVDTSN